MSRAIAAFVLGLLVGSSIASAAAAEPTVEEYLGYFPAHTNTITVLRVAEIKKSAVAKSNGWADSDSDLWLAGSEKLPGWIGLIVRGGHFHFGERGRDWSRSVTSMPEFIQLGHLAQGAGVKTQQVNGQSAFLSPRGAYITQLNHTTLGVLSPPDRADLSRWIGEIKAGPKSSLPPYLAEACANDPAQIIFARDLADVFDRWILRDWLKGCETLNGSSSQVDGMGELLDAIRGVKLSIQVSDRISASLRFQFSIPVSNAGKFGKPLLLEYLADQGAHLEDLQNAKVSQEGHELVLTMSDFSSSSLQRVLSMLMSPSPEFAKTEATENDPTATGEPTVKATQAYYDAVQSLLGDLEKQSKKSRDYLKTAVWHDQYSQKIDQLPYSGVDPAMLDFGRETSDRLRALAASLRGVPLEVNALQSSIIYNVNYETDEWAPWTAYGKVPTGVNVQTNLGEVRQQQAQAVAAGAKDRDEVWKMLVDSRNGIRRAMYDKYKVDFGEGESK